MIKYEIMDYSLSLPVLREAVFPMQSYSQIMNLAKLHNELIMDIWFDQEIEHMPSST